MEPNLAGSIYVRSSIKLLHLVPFDQQTWPPRWILFSDWLMLKKSSLKQLGQMEPNLAGSIYVRSKPGIDGPWVCPFQNCVRQHHPHSRRLLFFKVMIISLWNLLQYHSIVRWAIQAQWAEPLVSISHCVVCPSLIYSFWLPLWCCLFIFDLQLLVTPLVLSVRLWFTASDNPFGVVCPSLIYSF